MAPRLDSSMIYGVGIWPLKKPFGVYLVLRAQRMPLLQITRKFLEAPLSRTSTLLEWHMIGRWISLPCFPSVVFRESETGRR
jgi:hypothetical protein